MTLVQTIRDRIKAAMLEKREVEKSILRLALGEIQTAESRGSELSDEDVQKILRKIIAGNNETIAAKPDADNSRLEEENAILDSLLPKMWDIEQIKQFLTDQGAIDAVKAAPSDGAATGAAMKVLKPAKAPVDGKMVAQAVKELRA